MTRTVLYVLGGLALLYALLCGVMFVFQRSLQYFPDPRPMSPAIINPHLSSETLPTPDGERLVIWWSPPARPGLPTYLYLHGNGANLMARAARFQALIADGAGLMAVSWRGYGGSSGSPSEEGFMIDARTAHAALLSRVSPDHIVIVGESIGTGIATMLAAEVGPAAVLLDSSFTSVADVAAGLYPWAPVRPLIRDPFHADAAAPSVTAPVLQLHCRDDPVTPLALARDLTPLFPHALTMQVVDARCHTVPLADFMRGAQQLGELAVVSRNQKELP